MKTRKMIALVVMATLSTSVAQAQQNTTQYYLATENADTLMTNVDIKEVRVQAADVINKVGSDTYMPTKAQRALAVNAISLLDKMQVKGIVVNTIFNTVEASNGGRVVYLINGREVNLNDIIALNSSSILRIENDSNPGSRYADASVVLNFVLKQVEQGGNMFVDAMEGINARWGNSTFSGKFNTGNSEWSANYHVVHAKFKSFYNENEETYSMTDGTELTQTEEGIPGRLKYGHHFVTVNYNYLEPKRWMLNVAYKGRFDRTPNNHLDSHLTNPLYGTEPVDLFNRFSDNSTASSLDLYFQRNITEERMLLFNVVGTLTTSNYNNDYSILSGNDNIYSHHTNVDGQKRSIIGEAMYEHKTGDNSITIGAKETLSHTDNEYNSTTTTRLSQSDTYIYAQWQQKFDKFTYALGVGADIVHFSQGDIDYTHTFFRPMAKISYNPSDKISMSYKATIETKSPTLSELSDITTAADNYLVKRGNPNLKAATDLIQKMGIDFHPNKMFSTSLNANFTNRWNPVMESFGRESDKFFSTYENGDRWNKVNVEWGTRLKILYGLFSMHTAVGMDHYGSHGTNYDHSHTNFYVTGGATVAYTCVALTFDITTHRPSLYGETLSLGEDLHDIALTYFKNNLQISLAMNNPFMDNYKIGSERYNEVMPAKEYQYVNETSRMLLARVNYTIDFGRKHKTNKQRLTNEDTDNGMVKGK